MNKSIDFLFIGKSVFLGIPLLIDYFFMAFSFIIRFVLDQSLQPLCCDSRIAGESRL